MYVIAQTDNTVLFTNDLNNRCLQNPSYLEADFNFWHRISRVETFYGSTSRLLRPITHYGFFNYFLGFHVFMFSGFGVLGFSLTQKSTTKS